MNRIATSPARATVVLAVLACSLAAASSPGRCARAQGGQIQRPGAIQQPGPIQQPTGTWQKPGEIQQPKGQWQTPGEIQLSKGIQAIKAHESSCEQRLTTVADALFEFDHATLSPDAEQTLAPLGPPISQRGQHPIVIEGHTDAIGSEAHNQRLSEQRAEAVRAWLATHHYVPAATPIKGYGKRHPVAPNTHPDGSDDPAGRQKNRRVEV